MNPLLLAPGFNLLEPSLTPTHASGMCFKVTSHHAMSQDSLTLSNHFQGGHQGRNLTQFSPVQACLQLIFVGGSTSFQDC